MSVDTRIRIIIILALFMGSWLFLPAAATESPQAAAPTPEEAALNHRLDEIKRALNELEFDRALAVLQTIESSRHCSVLLLQAFCHELGIGVIIDANKSRELALEAAKSQDWEAAQFLAWQSITGNVGEPNLLESEIWRKRSIEWEALDDHQPVLPEVIMVPEKNGYVPRYELVNPWIQEKALAGDAVAQYNLYKTLIDGRSTFANVNRAMSWLQQSADGGFPLAARMMAFYYEHGFILQKNPQMEIKYLRIAAQADDAESQFKLGMRLLKQSLSGQQVAEAIGFLERAAGRGHAGAAYELAELYYDGERVPQDWEKAFSFYSIASRADHADAIYNLAWMTSYGQGVPEDKARGIALYKEAVDAGSKAAAMRLSKIHLYGWGTQKDPRQAIEWANKAIAMGNEFAYRMLGEVYFRGGLGEPDFEKAFLNFEIAAREGDDDSQYMMGQMLFMGKGIDRDLEEALSWYRLAAGKGHEKARMQALKMEGFGWGTRQDTGRLVDYYRLMLEEQQDIVERNADDMLRMLEKRGWEPGSAEERLVNALRMAGDPAKKAFVRDEMLHYKVGWFSEHIVAGIGSAESKPDVSEYSEEEWQLLVSMELDQRKGSRGAIPPKAVYQPAPVYPRGFKAFRVEDRVDLVLEIGKDGRVTKHRYQTRPLPQLKQVIEDILPYWRFIPGTRDGEMVATRVRISIPFRLSDNSNNY